MWIHARVWWRVFLKGPHMDCRRYLHGCPFQHFPVVWDILAGVLGEGLVAQFHHFEERLVVMLSVPRKRRNQSYVIICPSVVFSVQLLSHCFVSPEAGSGTTPIRASAQTDLHFLWGGNLHLLVLRFLSQ